MAFAPIFSRSFLFVVFAIWPAPARAETNFPSTTPSITSPKKATAKPPKKGTAKAANKAGTKSSNHPPLQMKEVRVESTKLEPSASAEVIPYKSLDTKPHDTPIQILNDLPGLVAVQHQGGGKAPQYLIRGFDADHGTDFAVFADGVPVNLVTHAHGQGYADLNLIIPETIDHLDFTKGPYYAKLGDFDNAGALDFVTKDEFPENFVHAEGGSWDTQRYVLGLSPKLFDGVKTLLAGQAAFTNGPFDSPEHDTRLNFFGKLTGNLSPDSTLSASYTLYHSHWDGSGQIPEREVVAQRLGRFGSEDNSEGGQTDFDGLTLKYRATPTQNDTFSMMLYARYYKLNLYTDFTFYKDTGLRFIREPSGAIVDTRDGAIVPGANYIPGDGIEQNDSRWMFGGMASWVHTSLLRGILLESEFGIQQRNDDIDVGLYRQVRRQRFFTVNQPHVWENSISAYSEQRLILNDKLRAIVGLRGDVYFFGANDRLPAQAPDPNFTAVPISGSTSASIVSPKASLIYSPIRNTDFYLNFGTGFHSNDARDAILTQNSGRSPLARSIGAEIGARTRQFDRLDLSTALWIIDLDSELVFNGDAGNQETGAGGNFVPEGSTRRWGVDFLARYQILEWLYADYDLTYADPRFRSSGEAIPLAPTLLMNGDLTVEAWKGFSAGLRVRFLDDRPANEDRTLTARGYTLIDLIGKYRWKNTEVSLQILNLTDHDWREAQFADNSCVRHEIGNVNGCSAMPGQQGTHPDPPADIHFTPGNPLTVIGGLTVFF